MSDRQSHLLVIDPAIKTGRVKVPMKKIVDTKGFQIAIAELQGPNQGRGKKPASVCLLFQQGTCKLGNQCNQIHVEVAFISQMRAEAAQSCTCCAVHGDVASDDRSYKTLLGDKIKGQVMLEKKDGASKWISPYKFARTQAMLSLLEGLPNESTVVVPMSKLCAAHYTDSCKYGRDCKNLHVCREEIEPAVVPPTPTPVKATSQAAPPAAAAAAGSTPEQHVSVPMGPNTSAPRNPRANFAHMASARTKDLKEVVAPHAPAVPYPNPTAPMSLAMMHGHPMHPAGLLHPPMPMPMSMHHGPYPPPPEYLSAQPPSVGPPMGFSRGAANPRAQMLMHLQGLLSSITQATASVGAPQGLPMSHGMPYPMAPHNVMPPQPQSQPQADPRVPEPATAPHQNATAPPNRPPPLTHLQAASHNAAHNGVLPPLSQDPGSPTQGLLARPPATRTLHPPANPRTSAGGRLSSTSQDSSAKRTSSSALDGFQYFWHNHPEVVLGQLSQSGDSILPKLPSTGRTSVVSQGAISLMDSDEVGRYLPRNILRDSTESSQAPTSVTVI